MPVFEPLIDRRYGASAPAVLREFEGDHPVLETLFSHKSVRHYKPDPPASGTLELLATAAWSAASSSNLQAWSVVAIQDKAHKDAAALRHFEHATLMGMPTSGTSPSVIL